MPLLENNKLEKVDENKIFNYQSIKTFTLFLFIGCTLFLNTIKINPNISIFIDSFKRTPAFYSEILLIFTFSFGYIRKLIKTNLKINSISLLMIILFCYSLIVNLFYFSSFGLLVSDNYYQIYFLHITSSILLINELRINKQKYYLVINLIIFASLIYSLFILLGGDFTVINPATGRITISGWKENDISFLISFAYALICIYLSEFNKKNKIILVFYILASILLMNAVMLTGTRAGIFVIGGILFTIMGSLIWQKSNSFNKFLFIIFNFGYYLYKNLSYEPITERFFVDNFTSVGGRMVHWLFTLEISNQNPFFGIGLEKYAKLCLEVLNMNYDPQNFFLEIYVTTGIFSLFLLSITIVFFIAKSIVIFIKTKNLSNLILLIPVIASMLVLNIRNMRTFFIFLSIFAINIEYFSNKINLTAKELFYISRRNTYNKI